MMPVLILCGGKGTRLGELTTHTPKYLVDVLGDPFAYWQLTLLREAGYTDIVLLTGHLHEQIQAVVGDGSQWGVRVTYQQDVTNHQDTHQTLIDALDRPSFVLYGDSYLECDYQALERRFVMSDRDALLTWYHGIDYGIRAFRRYPPRHADFVDMRYPFMEIGSHAGLAQLRTHLSQRNQPDRAGVGHRGD